MTQPAHPRALRMLEAARKGAAAGREDRNPYTDPQLANIWNNARLIAEGVYIFPEDDPGDEFGDFEDLWDIGDKVSLETLNRLRNERK